MPAADRGPANTSALEHRLRGWKIGGFSPAQGTTVLTARDGNPVPVLDGLPLHSRIRPVEEARNRMAAVAMDRVERIVYIPGDFLYDLESLLATPRPHLKRLDIVFHSGALLECLWAHRDLSFLAQTPFDVHLHVVEGAPVPSDFLQSGFGDMSRTRFLGNPGLGHKLREWQGQVLDIFRGAVRGMASRALTQEHFEKRWTLNLLQNLSSPDGWPAWPTDGKGGDAILAAAGPSLVDQLPTLVRCRKRVFLAAVDTALRPLMLAGITPDLVVALDGGYFNTLDFERLPGDAVPLAMDVACHPLIGRLWKGPVGLFSSQPQEGGSGDIRQRLIAQAGLTGAFPVVPTAGHIAHTALGVMARLGYHRVGLMGLDMAYPFLETHAPSTCHQRFDYDRSGRMAPLVTGGFSRIRHRNLEVFEDAVGATQWRDGGMASHPALLRRATLAWEMEVTHLPGSRVARGEDPWRPTEVPVSLDRIVFTKGTAKSHAEPVARLLGAMRSFPIRDEVMKLGDLPNAKWPAVVLGWPVVGPGTLATVMALAERGSSDLPNRLEALATELEKFRGLVVRRMG